jgi:hypothetical protein
VYRAHLTVYGSDPKPLTIRGIEKAFSPRAVGGQTGTRHGQPGIWVERRTAAEFRAAIDKIARFSIETGYGFTIGCTNAPSEKMAKESLAYWMLTRGLTFSQVRVWRA